MHIQYNNFIILWGTLLAEDNIMKERKKDTANKNIVTAAFVV